MATKRLDRADRRERNGASSPKGGTRPIDYGPLDQAIGYVLRRAQMAVFRGFFRMFSELDIRPAQYSVLTIIERNPGLSQTQVSEALGIKKTNFVALIDELEARGLARRAPTETDRRSYALFLTDDGKALMRRLHRLAAEHERSVTQRFSAAERDHLFAALRMIAESDTSEAGESESW